jgi:hypothetical protein
MLNWLLVRRLPSETGTKIINTFVCVATNLLGEAQQLAIRYGQEHNNVKYRIVDVSRKETYDYLINDADVVIRYRNSSSADKNTTSLLTNWQFVARGISCGRR